MEITENLPVQSSPLHLPVLDAIPPSPDKNNLLTGEELIDQTALFIGSFAPLLARNERPDDMVFLLKSSLPVALVMKDVWPSVYPETPMPDIHYVNIGRRGMSEVETSYDMRTGRIHETSYIAQVKMPSVRTIQSHFIGLHNASRIMVVDEWSEHGTTIAAAARAFSDAFPQAGITTAVVYSKRPHWYNMPSYLGIEEADQFRMESLALRAVNRTFGTAFSDEWDMMGDPRVAAMRQMFYRKLDSLGNSPYGVAKPEDFDQDVFRAAKEERKIIAQQVCMRLTGNAAAF